MFFYKKWSPKLIFLIEFFFEKILLMNNGLSDIAKIILSTINLGDYFFGKNIIF